MRLIFGTLALLLAFVAPALAAPPSETELRQAVQELGSDNFAKREKAMRLLWAAGPAAEPFLKESLNSSDPEVARRVRVLMDRIIYRIDPGTPPEVVSLVDRYRKGTAEEQVAVLREMLRLGGKAHTYVVRMFHAVDAQRRRVILDQFAFDDWKVLAPMMVEGQAAVAEEIINLAVAAQIDSIIPHYAMYYANSPKLGEKIAGLRTELERGNNPFMAQLLVRLYRVKNDHDGMLWAAQHGDHPDTIRILLQERGQWNEILDKYPPPATAGLSQITGLGYTAAYQRLAGRHKDFEETLKKIEEYTASPQPRKDSRPWYAAKALLINEQPARALAILTAHDQHALAADFLMAHGKFREALERSEKMAKGETGTRYAERSAHIQLLQRVGQIGKAKEWLAQLQKDMGQSADPAWLERQIMLEAKLGLNAEALKHLQERIDLNDSSYLGPAFSYVFPELAMRAETLYRLFRLKNRGRTTADLLQMVQVVEERKHKPNELADALKTAEPSSTWLPTQSMSYAYENLASLVELFDMGDVAKALLAAPAWSRAPAMALTMLADTLAAAEQWEAAAAAYRRIWEADRSNPLTYFLHGWALAKSGKEAEGKATMERSHRMSLGSDATRQWFYAALMERGFLDDAAMELEARRMLLPRDSYYYSVLQHDSSRAAAASGRFMDAASLSERNLLRALTMNMGARSPNAYLRAVANIHAMRARALVDQGKFDEAFKEIDKAQEIHPVFLDLPIMLVAALEKKGQKEKADEIYHRIERALLDVCRDYPDFADAHNQVAWLAVRCRRNLDAALKHSLRAVELAPHTAAYADTLAEVYFQKGERGKSIELIKKCLKMPSANVGFYRLQLQRFTSGDPKSEPSFEY